MATANTSIINQLLSGGITPGASTEAARAGKFNNLLPGQVFGQNRAISNGVPIDFLTNSGGPRQANPGVTGQGNTNVSTAGPRTTAPAPVPQQPQTQAGAINSSQFARPSLPTPQGITSGNVSSNFQGSQVLNGFDPNAPLIQNGLVNGVPVQDLNSLGTTIPPEVQALMDQLTSRGQDINERALNTNRLNFGAGDKFNSAVARSEALLGGELNNNLLSNVLGIGAQSAEQQRDRVFGERQNLLASAAAKQQQGIQLSVQENLALQQNKLQEQLANLQRQTALDQQRGETFRHGQSLDQQLNLAQLDADQMNMQILLALLGNGNTSTGNSINQGQSSSSSGGFSFGL